MTRPDAIVAGAGAIGAACAYELAGAGLRVTVVDRAAPGAEASGASAGILSLPEPTRSDALATLVRLSRDLYGLRGRRRLLAAGVSASVEILSAGRAESTAREPAGGSGVGVTMPTCTAHRPRPIRDASSA